MDAFQSAIFESFGVVATSQVVLVTNEHRVALHRKGQTLWSRRYTEASLTEAPVIHHLRLEVGKEYRNIMASLVEEIDWTTYWDFPTPDESLWREMYGRFLLTTEELRTQWFPPND